MGLKCEIGGVGDTVVSGRRLLGGSLSRRHVVHVTVSSHDLARTLRRLHGTRKSASPKIVIFDLRHRPPA